MTRSCCECFYKVIDPILMGRNLLLDVLALHGAVGRRADPVAVRGHSSVHSCNDCHHWREIQTLGTRPKQSIALTSVIARAAEAPRGDAVLEPGAGLRGLDERCAAVALNDGFH